jgi:asparaginyl-tRNA synthetase
VVHQLAQDYPISLKDHGTSFLMDHRHLWIRSKRQHAIIKIRHQVIKSCRDFLDYNGFTLVDTPIFTANACEGTSNLFNVDYFDRSAYLTQSGQLYSEASAASFGKVYCFGPTFRAEKSKTRRHLTEFWMVEPEMAYCDLNGNMDLAEQFVETIVQSCLKNCKNELDILERDTSYLEKVKAPFPRITYDEAAKILSDNGADFSYGDDFGGTDETIISEQYDRPVMVHRWPVDIKAFYMKRDKNDKLALGVDMLAPEGYGEIIGGGQREDNLEILEKRIEEHGLDKKDFKWYLDLRKYGSVPHSGFGLGIERTVAWITGIKHIRETIPFPRTISRLEP